MRRQTLQKAAAAARPAVSRRTFVARAAYEAARKMMPKISDTERVALGCGTVGFDREIFSGKPSLENLLTYAPLVTLTDEEKSFLANETEELCGLVDDFKVLEDKDFSGRVWRFMRRQGVFCFKNSEGVGGKGFSTAATSAVLVKLGTASSDLASTVAVPNSLGPGELLLVRYGTPEQQKYYLPYVGRHVHPLFRVDGYSFRERRYFTHRELWWWRSATAKLESSAPSTSATSRWRRRRFSGYWF